MFPKRCLILLACSWTLLQSVVAVPDVSLEQTGPEDRDRRLEERDFGLKERHNHPALESSLLSVLTEELATTHGPKPSETTAGGGGGDGTTAPGEGGGTTVPGGGGGTTAPGGGGGTTVPGEGVGTTVPGEGAGTTVPGEGGKQATT